MKIMYIVFEGFDTANGTNHLALTTIQTFLDSGIDVYLVTSHSEGIFPDIPDALKKKKGFSFSVIPRNRTGKKNFVRRYLNGMFYAGNACREWKKHKDGIDVVLLQSTPTVFFSSYLLYRHMKKPVIYNSFDVFPDGPFLYGAVTSKTAFAVLALMQSFVYRTSDRIVVISDDMKQTFLKKGIRKSKLVTIPNWYDASTVREVVKGDNQFIKKYSIDTDKFIVQYAGNFGYTFNYRAVIRVAGMLQNYREIEFHMVGTGGFEDDFKKEAEKASLSNIRFFPWQDSSMMNDVYSSCDIAFVPLSEGVIWTSFPSKCAILMACGRTFVCMCETESAFSRFVCRNQAGVCISRKDYKAAARKILELSEDSSKVNAMGKNARKCGEKYFSSAVNAQKYVSLIRESVREAGSRK